MKIGVFFSPSLNGFSSILAHTVAGNKILDILNFCMYRAFGKCLYFLLYLVVHKGFRWVTSYYTLCILIGPHFIRYLLLFIFKVSFIWIKNLMDMEYYFLYSKLNHSVCFVDKLSEEFEVLLFLKKVRTIFLVVSHPEPLSK